MLRQLQNPLHVKELLAEKIIHGFDIKSQIIEQPETDWFTVKPYDYQYSNALFAIDSIESRGGAFIADEVGLGKSISAGLVIFAYNRSHHKKILVVAPSSIRTQWVCELEDKFGLSATIIDGSSKTLVKNSEICICSYDFLYSNIEVMSQIYWDLVVYDESHYLSSPKYLKDGKPNNTASTIMHYMLPYKKLLLTATPMKNNLGELFHQITFVDKEAFGSVRAMVERYADSNENTAAIRELVKRLSGVLSRNLRKNLGTGQNQVARHALLKKFSLTQEEQEVYDQVHDFLQTPIVAELLGRSSGFIRIGVYKRLGSSFPACVKSIQGILRSLEQAKFGGNFDGLENALSSDDLIVASDSLNATIAPQPDYQWDISTINKAIANGQTILESLNRISKKSSKLKSLLTSIRSIFRENQIEGAHKVLVFTESIVTQSIIKEYLEKVGISVTVFNGSLNKEQRDLAKKEFQDSTNVMIATDAACEGLNLQFCNVIYNYDLPWNPQKVEQRIGRCHRMGQTRPVYVVSMVNEKNPAEDRILELCSDMK